MRKEEKRTIAFARLRGYMAENGLRQSDLADLLGKTRAQANLKLNGKSEFTLGEVRTICNAWGIGCDEYFIEHPFI